MVQPATSALPAYEPVPFVCFTGPARLLQSGCPGVLVQLLLHWTLRILTAYLIARFAFQQPLLPFSCCGLSP